MRVVERPNARGAQSDSLDAAQCAVDLDHVAHLDRTLDEEDQAADEVRDDVLAAEARPSANAPPRIVKTVSGMFA